MSGGHRRAAAGLAIAAGVHGAVLLLPVEQAPRPAPRAAVAVEVRRGAPAAPVQPPAAVPSKGTPVRRRPVVVAHAHAHVHAGDNDNDNAGVATGAPGLAPAPTSSLHCPAWARCDGPTANSAPPQVDLRALLLQRIAAQRRYPEPARRHGIEGAVELRFRVAPDGRPDGVVVSRAAHPWLDEAAREALLRAAPLPPLPGTQSVTIEFSLRDPEDPRAEE